MHQPRNRVVVTRGAVATGVLAASLAGCATMVEPEHFPSEPKHVAKPIEVSASRIDRDTIRPDRDIPQTLSPMKIFTNEDLRGTGHIDIGSALQTLSPF